jgi:hypothetical protein
MPHVALAAHADAETTERIGAPTVYDTHTGKGVQMIRDWLEDDDDDETPPNDPLDNPDEFL